MGGDNTKAVLRLHSRIEKLMSDERFSDGRHNGHELRSFIVAYYWARFEGGDRDVVWQRTKQLAGLTGHRWGAEHTSYRLKGLYRADVPRFEPSTYRYGQPTCPVPMLRGPRVGEPCGRRGSYQFRVTDETTGEWQMQGFCTRHQADAEKERRIEQRRHKPEPTPNIGGLLPCYINATNWPDIYAAAQHGWKPPSIGIVADDWPVLARVVAHERPKFEVLDGEREGSGETSLPELRLVTS